MKVEFDRPVSIKIWFTVGGISRSVSNVSLMDEVNGIMKIHYRDKSNMRKTIILQMSNVTMIEEE